MRQIRLRSVTALACACVLVCAAEVVARTWTARNGETTTGKFVRVYNGQVVLSRGGRVVTFPLENFCDADQEYIREKAGLPPGTGSSPRGKSESGKSGPALPEFNEGPGYGPTGGNVGPAGSSGGEIDRPSSDTAGIADLELDFVVERTWTDVQGRKIRAKLVPTEDMSGDVTLLKDGKKFNIPRERLSPEDVSYVDEMRERIERLRRVAPRPEKGAQADGSGSPPKKKSAFPTWKPPGYGSGPAGGPSSASPPSPPSSDTAGAVPESPSAASQPAWPHPGPVTPPAIPHHTPPRPSSTPDFSFPAHTPSPSWQVEYKYCKNCRKKVPDDTKPGDHCPHCGVYFACEENRDGTKTWAPGAPFRWIGGFLLFFIVPAAIKFFRAYA